MIPLSILALHFVGDFLFQSDFMALNKSKSWLVLATHCLVYSVMFANWGLQFVGITFALHFVTDAITSRITSRLWFFSPIDLFYNIGGKRYNMYIPRGGDRHYFFVAIGADQLIHYICLWYTLRLLSL